MFVIRDWVSCNISVVDEALLGTGQNLEGGRAGAFLFWPTSFGETLPIPGAEKMLTPQNSLHNLSWPPTTHCDSMIV